ncbi:hypothetical protein [Xanthomonas campestris]|uniref:hypothetical protein n=1 Tax=Xanthomonas TaxID=338 RepID=UPI001E62E6F1|nr:hypothetical protein [Xanthomonas campestris]MCC5091266.1 hypothetical protein [Xanthomonas campestris]
MAENIEREKQLEAVARAVCLACEEVPDHAGDAQGNARRWQDYLPCADAAIAALTSQWQGKQEIDVVPSAAAVVQVAVAADSIAGMRTTQRKPGVAGEDVREDFEAFARIQDLRVERGGQELEYRHYECSIAWTFWQEAYAVYASPHLTTQELEDRRNEDEGQN